MDNEKRKSLPPQEATQGARARTIIERGRRSTTVPSSNSGSVSRPATKGSGNRMVAGGSTPSGITSSSAHAAQARLLSGMLSHHESSASLLPTGAASGRRPLSRRPSTSKQRVGALSSVKSTVSLKARRAGERQQLRGVSSRIRLEDSGGMSADVPRPKASGGKLLRGAGGARPQLARAGSSSSTHGLGLRAPRRTTIVASKSGSGIRTAGGSLSARTLIRGTGSGSGLVLSRSSTSTGMRRAADATAATVGLSTVQEGRGKQPQKQGQGERAGTASTQARADTI